MSNFNNNAYQSLVADLIGDTFYKDTSVSGRISFVRKYAEVVIRKILDIDPNKAVTLGAKNIQNRIQLIKGKIDLNSEIGKGTSVLIEIPIV